MKGLVVFLVLVCGLVILPNSITLGANFLDAEDGDPAEAVYVDDEGNVGIGWTQSGATSPGLFQGAHRYLTISAAHDYRGDRIASLELQGSGIGLTDPVARLDFSYRGDTASSNIARIVARTSKLSGSDLCGGELVFYTNDGNALTQRLRIDRDGNVDMGRARNGSVGISITNLSSDQWSEEGIYFENEDGKKAGIALFDDEHVGYPARMRISNNRPNGSIQLAADAISTRAGLTVAHDGFVGIGTTDPQRELHVRASGGNAAIRLEAEDGAQWNIAAGDNLWFAYVDGDGDFHDYLEIDKTDGEVACRILRITGGSDIAEPFNCKEAEAIEPGMVLVIDQESPGKLKVSDRAHDRCVAGIVSGAGGISPGLTLTQEDSFEGHHHIALTGRVYGLCDASYGSIEPGDLLTTSFTAGHAMKVSDYQKAQGAILGKAMTRLEKGRGLVLVLVSLQ